MPVNLAKYVDADTKPFFQLLLSTGPADKRTTDRFEQKTKSLDFSVFLRLRLSQQFELISR